MCGCVGGRAGEDEVCVGGGEVCVGVWVRMRHVWVCGWACR